MASVIGSAFKRLLDETGTVDQVGIEERIAKFQPHSIKKKSKLWGFTAVVSMVDSVKRVKTRKAEEKLYWYSDK